MREVVHAEDRCADDVDDGRVAVDTEVLCDLVVGALDERGVGGEHGVRPALGHAAGHGHGLLLGDAHVLVLRSGCLTLGGSEAHAGGHGGRDAHQLGVALHRLAQVVAQRLGGTLGERPHGALSRLDVKGHVPVPRLLVVDGGLVAVSLLGVHMEDGGARRVLHLAEGGYERLDVVALLHIVVVEAEGAEEVALGLPLGLPEQGEVAVEATVVLGDGHLVVVDHDDDVGAELGRHVEALKGLAATERAVADDHHDVLLAAQDVTPLLQAGGQGDGGGGVADLEVVVRG